MKKILIIILPLLTLFLLNAQTLLMGADETTKQFYPFINEILTEAGISNRLIIEPSGRSLIEANQGNLDGEIWRIYSTQKDYPNLLPTITPVLSKKFYAYVLKEGTDITSAAELEGKRVGIVRGVLLLEKDLDLFDAEIVKAKDPNHLMELLEYNRIDAAIANDVFLNRTDNPDYFKRIVPPLITADIHIWLNKKHQALLPSIEKVLQDWGEEKLREKYLELFLDEPPNDTEEG
jgi:polar amino acid transport system substrate-binding protein